MALPCSPSEPHTTGLMSLVSEGPTTAAPAPSPKMNAVLRSVKSMPSLIFSTPITTTYREAPPRIMFVATARPYPNPAQPAVRSNAAMPLRPRFVATWGAAWGTCVQLVDVHRMTASTNSGSIPAETTAFFAASVDIMTIDSSALAKRRLRIPDRS